MEMVSLAAALRDALPKANVLRKAGKVPCVVYGNKTANTSIVCEEIALKKAYIKAGESALVELDMAGTKIPVLFHDVAFDPVSDRLIHADFFAVDMTKEVEAPIPVRFEGESLAVKDLGAILVTPMDTVTVRCLPSKLPHDLPVDLGKLAEMHAVITVADLVAPEGVTILDDPETVLATVQEARKEEVVEVAPVAAEGAAAAPGAEGAAPAADAKEGDDKGKKE